MYYHLYYYTYISLNLVPTVKKHDIFYSMSKSIKKKQKTQRKP